MAVHKFVQQTTSPSLFHFFSGAKDFYSNSSPMRQHLNMTHFMQHPSNMNRILVIGSSGAGKSTLARHLGAKLELPVIHLDRHFWKPGWTKTPEHEWKKKVEMLVQRPYWIMDGNYRSTLDIRLAAADTVIFLDLPPAICAIRAFKRRLKYRNQPRPDIAQGCVEPIFDPQFPSFIQWILDYPNRARPDVIKHLNRIKTEKNIIWLKSPQEVQTFLSRPISKKPPLPLVTPQIDTEPLLRVPTD